MRNSQKQKNAQSAQCCERDNDQDGNCPRHPELIVVIHIQTRRERFSTDQPLVALLMSVNLGQPVIVTTEKMTRAAYRAIPASSIAREMGELNPEEITAFPLQQNMLVGTIS